MTSQNFFSSEPLFESIPFYSVLLFYFLFAFFWPFNSVRGILFIFVSIDNLDFLACCSLISIFILARHVSKFNILVMYSLYFSSKSQTLFLRILFSISISDYSPSEDDLEKLNAFSSLLSNWLWDIKEQLQVLQLIWESDCYVTFIWSKLYIEFYFRNQFIWLWTSDIRDKN